MNIETLQQHIPSSQTVPKYELLGKQTMITPFQYDVMNFICFEAQKQISMRYGLTETKQIAKSDELKLAKIEEKHTIETQEDLFNFLRNQVIKIDMNEVTTYTDKYKTTNRANMLKEIYKLQDIKAVVNQVKDDDGRRQMNTSRFPLITRIEHSSKSNILEIRLEHELIYGWVFNVIPFSKVLIKHQTYLSTMYAKQIYALCSEYQGLGRFSMEFNKLLNLLQLTVPNLSKLKGNYLNRAVKEINAYTNFNITKIYGKKTKGITDVHFEFTVEEVIEDDITDASMMENKKRTIALIRLEQSKQFQTIKNEEAWLKKTIDSITDEFIEQQEHIEEAKLVLDELDFTLFGELLMTEYNDMIGIKDYKLYYIFDETKPAITNNAKETYDVLLALEND